MKAIIKGGYETSINFDETQILFDDDWYNIVEDAEGEYYFMYEGKAIYFESYE